MSFRHMDKNLQTSNVKNYRYEKYYAGKVKNT